MPRKSKTVGMVPESSTELKEYVEKCAICCKEMNNPTEPLILQESPKLSWQTVATDLLMFKGSYICWYGLLLALYRIGSTAKRNIKRSDLAPKRNIF